MANIKNNASTQETRRKLLEAAGEVFAQKGLHATLIRDITERAGVNVAAVNYHFRDKFELYLTVLRQVHDQAIEATAPPAQEGPPAVRLRGFIEAIMRYMLDPQRPAWHAALFSRELSHPTAGLAELTERGTRDRMGQMSAMIQEILGESVDSRTVSLAVFSIFGQCVFYLHHRELINSLQPQLASHENLEMLVEFVHRFSIGALKELRRKQTRSRSGAPATKSARSRKIKSAS